MLQWILLFALVVNFAALVAAAVLLLRVRAAQRLIDDQLRRLEPADDVLRLYKQVARRERGQ